MLPLILGFEAFPEELKFLVGLLRLEDLHRCLFGFFTFLLWRGEYHLGPLGDEGKRIS